MDKELYTQILSNLISDIVIVFVGWAIVISLKAWIKSLVNEQMETLHVKIDDIMSSAKENHKSNEIMRSKMIDLKSDITKHDNQWKHILHTIKELKCMRGSCEDIN